MQIDFSDYPCYGWGYGEKKRCGPCPHATRCAERWSHNQSTRPHRQTSPMFAGVREGQRLRNRPQR